MAVSLTQRLAIGDMSRKMSSRRLAYRLRLRPHYDPEASGRDQYGGGGDDIDNDELRRLSGKIVAHQPQEISILPRATGEADAMTASAAEHDRIKPTGFVLQITKERLQSVLVIAHQAILATALLRLR
jgi:hypothetical protein